MTCRRMHGLARVLLALLSATAWAGSDDYYWKLGVGTYGTPMSDATEDVVLTHARFDWQMIAFGGGVDMPAINRCLAMNPRQRFLVRLWPVQHGDTFLDYLYTPGVKERIDQAIADQTRKVLTKISRPDNVVAFTFLEELPGRWHPFFRDKSDEECLALMAPHREAIEKELGRPLVYDDAQKEWLWDRFAASLDSIHAAIRAAAGPKRLVLFWPRFDWGEENILKKIAHPGGADGRFLYVLRPDQWPEQVKVAENNHWPFFSQLSLNTLMKQSAWQNSVALPHVKSRCNLGYFFYTSGNPLRPHFFDCQAIDPVNNVNGLSYPVHMRWFAADRNLGWDVFKRNIHFAPLIDFRPEGKSPGDIVDLYVMVPNPILEGHYPDEANRKVRKLTVRLKLPSWLEVESGAAKAVLGDLGPSRHRAPAPASVAVAHWRLRLAAPPDSRAVPVVNVSGRHPSLGTIKGRTEIDSRKNQVLPAFEERPVMVSGQGWSEPGFALDQDVRPTISIRTGPRAVSKPSLTDNDPAVSVSLGTYKDNAGYYRLQPVDPTNCALDRLVYDDTVPPHSTLTIAPDGRATLAPTRPLLEKAFAGADNPGPGVTGGYYLGAYGANRTIPSGEKVVVEVTGKKAGNVNSLLLVYFRCADTGKRTSMSDGLVNRFKDEWTRVTSEITPPYTNAILESVALYRFPGHATGTIWYGAVKADLATAPGPGRDVSVEVRGMPPLLRAGRNNFITYFDEDTQQPEGSKINVRLIPPTNLKPAQ
ncbi:MAG: hypothetical protein PHR35_04395 [Kiritimatiellae bacterium]|nr:hypothetical protein [Kiritimatiellia bacterium]